MTKRSVNGITIHSRKLLREIRNNIEAVLSMDSALGQSLWEEFLKLHPVDMASFFMNLDKEPLQELYLRLPAQMQFDVFHYLPDRVRLVVLQFLAPEDKVEALNKLHADDLADFFEILSDTQLKEYLNLLHKSARKKVLSLLEFDPESAGGIMDAEVISFMQDFTVEKSVKILQRLSKTLDIYQQIYITDVDHHLVGYINLEDLVLQSPTTRIAEFMKEVQFVALADEDQETVAREMARYELGTIPVVSKDNHLLGVIPSETLIDVLVEEASEDVQKMAALTPLKESYFDTSFFRLFYNRTYILIALLLAESFSGTILHSFEATLTSFLTLFIPMLVSTGGNTSSQTSALVIQGMASGDIRPSNVGQFLRREFMMATLIGIVLGVISFARAYLMADQDHLLACTAISLTVAIIVMLAVMLGSCIPLILKRFGLDPALSAGPVLATILDVLGILIFCYVAKIILF